MKGKLGVILTSLENDPGLSLKELWRVVAIPFALKTLVGIVFSFESEEVGHLRVARGDVVSSGPAVVRQIERAVILDNSIEDLSKCCFRTFDSRVGVADVQIADDTHGSFASPRQKRLAVWFDESDRTVTDICFPIGEIVPDSSHKREYVVVTQVDFGDHFSAMPRLHSGFVSGKSSGKLVRVGPVNLTIGLQIELRVDFKRSPLVRPGQSVEIRPILS